MGLTPVAGVHLRTAGHMTEFHQAGRDRGRVKTRVILMPMGQRATLAVRLMELVV